MEMRGQSLRGCLGCLLAPTPTIAFSLIELHPWSADWNAAVKEEQSERGKARACLRISSPTPEERSRRRAMQQKSGSEFPCENKNYPTSDY